jgi:hypothetical protein
VALAEAKGGTANNLEDGIVTIGIRASDYRGNTMTYTGSIEVSNDLAQPDDPAALAAARGAGQGQGGFPGGGPGTFPGGFPGAAPGGPR